ncbi:MAG TPA: hypothetical protein VHY22_13465 [Chthoniobacteraceae bacterium]|jgi:hypothetical protein|nr:hypothetical protein [Chthoniobacteraceae bacterium]
MSNWTTISVDDLKAVGYGQIVDRARSMAVGGVDPAAEAIANAVSRVRRAISTGNTMDADAAKVPNSLKNVAVKLAFFNLMGRLRLDLSPSEAEDKRDQISDLKRIQDDEVKVEEPDTPGGNAEMQHGNTVGVIRPVRQQTTREGLRGL